jgi:hypothetical protein
MNTTQHTPGPWVYDSFGHTSFAFNDNREDYSARIEWAPDMGDEEVDANARLIAAAPEMLDALQAVCDACGEQDSLLMAQVKAALDKAKGGAK